jgi:CRISPR-associated protein Csx17
VALSPHDVTPFLLGETDDNLIEDLLWGFTVVHWRWGDTPRAWRRPVSRGPFVRSYCALKLVLWPGQVRGKDIRPEPTVPALLRAGRIEDALRLANRRLLVSGLSPFGADYRDGVEPLRLAAALVVPVAETEEMSRAVLAPAEQD